MADRVAEKPQVEPEIRRRRTRTRERLITAAKRLLAEGPREAFTIDDAVQAAGVSKGSFYNHFTDRDALICEVHRIISDREEAEIETANSCVTDPVRRIAQGVAIYARLAVVAPEDARILASSGFRAVQDVALDRGLTHDLRAGVRLGRLAIPSVEVGAMLVAGQVAILLKRLGGMPPKAAASLAQQSLAVTLVGLGLEHREAHLLAAQAVELTMGDIGPGAAEAVNQVSADAPGAREGTSAQNRALEHN